MCVETPKKVFSLTTFFALYVTTRTRGSADPGSGIVSAIALERRINDREAISSFFMDKPQLELAALAGDDAVGAGISFEVSATIGIGAMLGSGGL